MEMEGYFGIFQIYLRETFFLCETFLDQKSETFYGDAGQENVISE